MLLISVALLASGCSDDPGRGEDGAQSADCALGVLSEGLEFVERGFVDEAGEPVGTGALARCDDTGPAGEGLVFDLGGEAVDVLELPGVPRHEAVLMEVSGTYAVLLNEALDEERASELVEQFALED